MSNLTLGFMFTPAKTWSIIGRLSDAELNKKLLRPILLPMVTAFCFYYGAVEQGWHIMGRVIKIDSASAIPLAVMFYFAMLLGVVTLGLMAHWMSKTYDANSNPIKGVVLVGFAGTPVFVAGIFALVPLWWFDILVATAACSYAIRLLYMGIPPVMKVPEDQGMMYSSALFLVALVYMVVVLVATAILWEYVAPPVFVD